MPHGWIILDKPLELGSTQAVAAVKRNLRQAGYGKVKVGHGGTLDPLATGVLPIAVGEATKLAGRMLDATKAYAFTLAFGAETTTLDAEGEVTETSDVRPTRDRIEAVLPSFIGPIAQVPPAYSALKVDGKRAYDLARAGEEVTLKTRSVTIHTLSITDCTADSVTLMAKVSKGTYIRSLARDIARALETVGHVTMLRRVKAGPFTLESAISLDKLNEIGKGAPLEDMILPLEAGLDDIPALILSPDAAGAVRQGRKLSGLPEPDGTYWGREGDTPVALMEVTDGEARVLRGFNL
ncbi:tRNA pseudouridine(55) synthase TruB [Croceicoccus naphthovorans]|uniref:tRNA pseudouridine synthase B n=1 Tax=Croceicoccus naphthovorans TaxID=1348774 RepID=A0A0G3XBF3_9SPHN|nr:tRNA pseudouridine(55) synthase TruB [Croceicoccus naphthovorans]AKM08875.1 pseudouridine synthase [Croceicoccus naphthovorans]MBB3989366.1 tRNA pseudouridine55 synthase [Croceicoccus naphthovorans]